MACKGEVDGPTLWNTLQQLVSCYQLASCIRLTIRRAKVP